MVLLTATPHSGDGRNLYRLLGLLHPDFASLAHDGDARNELLRKTVPSLCPASPSDIDEWHDGKLFPKKTDHGADLQTERRMGTDF